MTGHNRSGPPKQADLFLERQLRGINDRVPATAEVFVDLCLVDDRSPFRGTTIQKQLLLATCREECDGTMSSSAVIFIPGYVRTTFGACSPSNARVCI